jgi:hypothetical protein
LENKKYAGFHGDAYLLKVVDYLAHQSKFFVETGTFMATTLSYVAFKYPKLECLSCEPNGKPFRKAVARVAGFSKAKIFNETSQAFMKRLATNHNEIFGGPTLLWIDAHGHGFRWPLRQEIKFFTSSLQNAFMLIDDFRVPGQPQFRFDRHERQVCSFEYIKNFSNPRCNYRLYYPKYKKHTSEHHPLIGWGLFQIGAKNTERLDKRFPELVHLVK